MPLSQTKLASTMTDEALRLVEPLGEYRGFAAGQELFDTRNHAELDLHVIVRGHFHLERPGGVPVWLGPGDVVGEIGFVLGTPRTASAHAGEGGAEVWRVPRSSYAKGRRPEHLAPFTRLFAGLSPLVRVRHAKVLSERARAADGDVRLEDHCDPDHPAIRHLAEFLRGEDAWGTACAIFDFVRQIPYRIGFWQVRASQTLELGFGMCTTKSNLQVALLRASGIEARFAEVLCDAATMDPILPRGYQSEERRKRHLKHYFAIARFGERWIPMDATFPTVVWRHLHPAHEARPPRREEGVNPLGAMLQRDADDFRPMADLAELMRKQPFFDADGVEAMNVVLDRLQGRVLPPPAWAGKIERLIVADAHAAFLQSYSALTLEAQRLRALIVDRPSQPHARGGELEYVI
jgi:transglutaminase-like putative cysteine protease